MEYDFPLMRDEGTFYFVPAGADIDEGEFNRPGALIPTSDLNSVHQYRAVREWWEPIEDEI